MSPGAAGGPGDVLPTLRHPPVTCDTHGAGIWLRGQQGPHPPQSLTCCAPTRGATARAARTRDTAPVTVTTTPALGSSQPKPNTSLGWWWEKVGPRRSRPVPLY